MQYSFEDEKTTEHPGGYIQGRPAGTSSKMDPEELLEAPGPGGSCASGCIRKARKYVRKRLPILGWLPGYRLDAATADILAGLTVGMTVIPQGIAYAGLAGLQPQYGLYSAFVGGFVYCLLGTTSHVTIGPVSILALMTGMVTQHGADYAVLLAFFTGIITFAFGILQLGFFLEFISIPVIVGFTSAASLRTAILQLRPLLGIKIPKDQRSATRLGIVDGLIDIGNNIHTCRYTDTVLGIVCCVLLLLLRALDRTKWFKPSDGPTKGVQAVLNKVPARQLSWINGTVWFICTGRNAVIVIACIMLAMLSDPECIENMKYAKVNGTVQSNCIFELTGEVNSGVPAFQPPPFSTIEDGEVVDFMGMTSTLGSAIIMTPLIAILECIALSKAFSKGKPVDSSQEMIALGLANIIGSFVSSMPVTASFSRTAINNASGVRTQMGGVTTGVLILICLAFFMPYCAFIPKAVLASVIMTAVIFNIEYEVVMPMWKTKKLDLIPAFATFFACIFYEQLEVGIVIGVGCQLIFILYSAARPKVSMQLAKIGGSEKEYIHISLSQGVIFPSATYVRNLISKEIIKQDCPSLPIVIDCSRMMETDFTGARGFKDLIVDFNSRNISLYWLQPAPGVARAIKALAGDSFRRISDVEELLEERQPSLPLLLNHEGNPAEHKNEGNPTSVNHEENPVLENQEKAPATTQP